MDAALSKHRRIKGPERERLAGELQTAYYGGASIRDLAEETGRSYGFVNRILRDAGTRLRPRGGGRVARTSDRI
ncbi:helix-turn-helix domain-containing protein [Kitasatospora sp. NPDC048540]|uniref:helix-turn-helix domain-containing protein n=1 Tax=unclassified Kitasatospora TaxID=2633591 RepID=UPI00053B3DC0|nr:helix-turn-helix domain-containing protein [Kitasatospora sp. MBT63]